MGLNQLARVGKVPPEVWILQTLWQSGFSETVKMTGSAIRIAMFMTWRVKIRAMARWNGVEASAGAGAADA